MSYYLEMLQKQGMTLSSDTLTVRRTDISMTTDNRPVGNYYGGGQPRTAITSDGLRICCRCKQPKPSSAYTKNKNKCDGLDARCRACKSAVAKERRIAN